MTSSINSTSIDSTFPIAGQDNDSQGFRDNFTNIKSQFINAADEITDLQAKVVLTTGLSGDTSDPYINNGAGAHLDNFVLSNSTVVFRTIAASVGAPGDLAGHIAYDTDYIYVCYTDYSDGLSDIWSRIAFNATAW